VKPAEIDDFSAFYLTVLVFYVREKTLLRLAPHPLNFPQRCDAQHIAYVR
jgi:hypothetical protein